jgi:hypothetical protein
MPATALVGRGPGRNGLSSARRVELVELGLADGLTVRLPIGRAQEQLRPLASESDLRRVQETLREAHVLSADSWTKRRDGARRRLADGNPLGLACVTVRVANGRALPKATLSSQRARKSCLRKRDGCSRPRWPLCGVSDQRKRTLGSTSSSPGRAEGCPRLPVDDIINRTRDSIPPQLAEQQPARPTSRGGPSPRMGSAAESSPGRLTDGTLHHGVRSLPRSGDARLATTR